MNSSFLVPDNFSPHRQHSARCEILLHVLVTAVSPAKTTEPIEMRPFGVGPRNHVLDQLHVGATWPIRFNDPSSSVEEAG